MPACPPPCPRCLDSPAHALPAPCPPCPPSRRPAGKWLLTSALLCVLLPWRWVLGGLGLAPLLLAAHTVMRPRVLVARDDEEEDLGEGAHVLFAGSFNPMHAGHLALLAHAARRHPRSTVFACVAYNPSKVYAVSPQVCAAVRAASTRPPSHPHTHNTRVIARHKRHMARCSTARRGAACRPQQVQVSHP